MTDTIIPWCYHEAAHAVVGMKWGRKILRTRWWPNGDACVEWDNDAGKVTREGLLLRALVTAHAGIWAEGYFGGAATLWDCCRDDLRDIRLAVKELEEGPVDARQLNRDMEQEAIEICRSRIGTIEAIAAELHVRAVASPAGGQMPGTDAEMLFDSIS